MGITFWIRRTVAVFVIIGAALFAVSLLKWREAEVALAFAAGWSAVSTGIFITTRVIRVRRSEHCELCQDTPRSMPLPPGAVNPPLQADDGRQCSRSVTASHITSSGADETFGPFCLREVKNISCALGGGCAATFRELSSIVIPLHVERIVVVHIRPFQPSDAEVLQHLFYDSIQAIRYGYTPEQLNAWASAAANPERWRTSFRERTTFVAESEGFLVGFAELEEGGRHIGRFYVRPDYQRRGIGRRLYRRLEEDAKSRGVVTLRVEASITAQPFFNRMGFGNERRQTVERKGVPLANFVMEKNLRKGAV